MIPAGLSSRNVRDHDDIESKFKSNGYDSYAIEAGSVLRVRLTGDALGRTHFALSPLIQVTSLMLGLKRGPMMIPPQIRRSAIATMGDKRLRLLSAIVFGARLSIPDFLGPTPARFHHDLNEALHQVCTAPPDRVGSEMTALLAGPASGGISPHPDQDRQIRQALDAGMDNFANRAAAELHQLWTHVIEPEWPVLRARLERDLAARAATVIEQGLVTTLEAVPGVAAVLDSTLCLDKDCSKVWAAGPKVVFVPSAFTGATSPVSPTSRPGAPLGEYPFMLWYVARTADRQSPGPSGELIGVTRAGLLAELGEPRTTSELASTMHLSSSTVSYHLQILHRAGLVRRVRRSRHVFYQAIPAAHAALST